MKEFLLEINYCRVDLTFVDVFILQIALLGNSNEDITESSYQYGRNIGIAFQVIFSLKLLISLWFVLIKRFLISFHTP